MQNCKVSHSFPKQLMKNLMATSLWTMPSSEPRSAPRCVVAALLKKCFYLHSGSDLRGTLSNAKYQTSEVAEGRERCNYHYANKEASLKACPHFWHNRNALASNGPRSVNTGPLPHEDNKRLTLFANTQVSSKARLSHSLPLPLSEGRDLNM